MALSQTDKNLVLAEFCGFLSTRPNVGGDPVAYKKADIIAAITAIDNAIDAAIPGIRQSANGNLPNAHKNKLIKFIVERKIS